MLPPQNPACLCLRGLEPVQLAEESKVLYELAAGLPAVLAADGQDYGHQPDVPDQCADRGALRLVLCRRGQHPVRRLGDDADALRLSPDRYACKLPDLPHYKTKLAYRVDYHCVCADPRLLPDDPAILHGYVHRLQCVHSEPLERNRHHAVLFARQL